MKNIKDIEKEFDKEFPFVCDVEDIMIKSTGEDVKEETKSFYRQQIKKLLEGLKISMNTDYEYFVPDLIDEHNKKIDKLIKDL